MLANLKTFGEFTPGESSLPSGRSLVLEDTTRGPSAAGKEETYRSIALKLSEIFGLYGFFLLQKPGFFPKENWTKLMDQLVAVKDPAAKWDTILKMSKFLQQKIASPGMSPTSRSEFGYLGQYDYGSETEDLPKATEFLKSASNAVFGTFTPEEKAKSIAILDTVLQGSKPLSFNEKYNYSPLPEGEQYLPPSSTDLMTVADSIGAKLLNLYDMVSDLKVVYPNSSQEAETFITTYILPNSEKVKKAIEIDIPNIEGITTSGFKGGKGQYSDQGYSVKSVKDKSKVDYLNKLTSLDKTVVGLIGQANTLRDKIVGQYQPAAASGEFEGSAQAIIDKVRQGIVRQATNNIKKSQTGDIVAGTTASNDLRAAKVLSGGAAQPSAEEKAAKKQKHVDDLGEFLAKKYQRR